MKFPGTSEDAMDIGPAPDDEAPAPTAPPEPEDFRQKCLRKAKEAAATGPTGVDCGGLHGRVGGTGIGANGL